jgi:four helix bundle protein
MASIKQCEDIEAWQKARELTRCTYNVTSIGKFASDFGLRDQIRRAAISVLSNIAEGFERGGNRELIHFWSIAKGSSGEIRSQIYVAKDLNYIPGDQFDSLIQQMSQISRLIAGFIKHLKQLERRGSKIQPNISARTQEGWDHWERVCHFPNTCAT